MCHTSFAHAKGLEPKVHCLHPRDLLQVFPSAHLRQQGCCQTVELPGTAAAPSYAVIPVCVGRGSRDTRQEWITEHVCHSAASRHNRRLTKATRERSPVALARASQAKAMLSSCTQYSEFWQLCGRYCTQAYSSETNRNVARGNAL